LNDTISNTDFSTSAAVQNNFPMCQSQEVVFTGSLEVV